MTHAMIVGQELTPAEVDMVTGAKRDRQCF